MANQIINLRAIHALSFPPESAIQATVEKGVLILGVNGFGCPCSSPDPPGITPGLVTVDAGTF